MKKSFINRAVWMLVLLLTIATSKAWGQGTESFEGLSSATNYASRSWTGTNGQTGWAATNARTDQKTAGSRGLTFQASTASTITMKLTSAQQSAGLGVLTFKYKYPYSDSGKSRQLSITIGGNTYSSGTLSYTSSATTGTITVNQSLASATVTINVNNGGGRICVDEFSWTACSSCSSKTLSSIAITTQPTTKKYLVGETFSKTGAVVTATYDDSSTADVSASATWTPTTGLVAGSNTITASYTEGGVTKTATTTVTAYAVTVQKQDEDGTTIADAGVTASASGRTITASGGSTNYVFKTWKYGTASGTSISSATSASTSLTGTPTAAVTIIAEFYKPITITYKANGSNFTTQTYGYGGTLAFPASNPDGATYSCTGKTFAGWVGEANKDYSHASSAPTYATEGGSVTAEATYYAVFADAEEGDPVNEWRQCTTLDDFIDGDFYLFVSPQYNSTYYYVPAVSAAAAQETFSSAADGNHVASNSTPTSITKAQGAWKLIKSSTSWKIQSSNASTIYLYTGTNNNKLGAATSGTATGTWTITKHASTSTFAFQYSGTSRYLCAYNASPYGFRTYTGTGTNGTAYLTVYHWVSYTPTVYSNYATACCVNNVALSTGTLSHCTMSISPTNLQTCSGTATDRQVTVTVTPSAGYAAPATLSYSGSGTATKKSGPTGSGPYTYVYEFDQNDNGSGTFSATCTAKNYTINLNDQSATTVATPSSIIVTFDASTNLTGTVLTTPPTRTGYTFGGYYTATGGGGTQIIATDGTVNASAGGGSTYTDASKNWKYADDLTIYAKWTEKALENYRTACMTFEVTNQTGTDDPDIHLTSYKGITVYATSAAGNLIRIQGKALEAAGVLGAGTNNKQNIRIKYFDMKSGSPVEVAKAQSPFRLCNDGTSNYNQADGSNININGLSSYDQTYSISYEPKEYGQTDHYQMEVRLQNNTTEAITVMVDLYGRSLPKEFVIATHSGASWYALPNDLAGTQGAQNLITPVAITVDNTSTPTKVTSVHDNVLYKGADRYTSANKNGLRFSNDGSHYLQVSTVLDVNKMWLSGSGGTDVQDWHLKSADFGAYEVYMDPIGTSTASDGRRIELYDSYIGYHGALTGTGNVYFLPMEYPEMGSSIMEWGTDHVVIFLATPGTATKVKVQVGGNAVGDAQTLSDIKKDEGVYRVTASLTTDDASAEIKLYFYTAGDVLVGSDKFTIPKLISAHDATTSGISKALAAECDLVILNGGILTVSQSTSGTQLAFRDLYIYGGGKLVVPSGKYISFDKVIMRGGHLNPAWEYQYSHPQLVLNGTMTNAEGKIYYDYLTNNAQFYSLSLPYNVTLTDIVNPDFNNKRSWQIHGYDGAKRASGSQVEGWYDVEEGSTSGSIAALSSSDHLTAGVGYTFWGAMQKVNGVRQRWSVNRFKMTLASGSAEAEKSGVTVTAHGMTAGELNDGVAPNDAGWNMLGNPYLADIGGTEGFETAVKGTIISWHNVKDEDENGNWTGTWHQESNETNVRYVRIPNNQGTEYEQTRFKDATLRAFHHFFIQVGDGGTFSFNISMRAQSAPSRFRKGASLPEEMDLDLRLTDGDNTSQFGLTLNNEFSAGYNGGDEDMTEDLSGTYVKAYTLVGDTRLTFNGLPYTAAEQLIPVGYRAQGNGYHTFSYKADADAHYIAHIWLTDKEESTVTDLKENTYKFYTDAGVNDERFTLNVVFTENTATGMDDGINDENGKPMKFIYRDQLYILRGGVIYDATGKRVREVNK